MNFLNRISETKRYKVYIVHHSKEDLPQIKDFLASQGIKTINLGAEIALFLSHSNQTRHLDILISERIENLINDASTRIPSFDHKIVVLDDLGVLLEPELKLKTAKLLSGISKNFHLLILWRGQANDKGLLCWTTQKEKFNFDFTQYQPVIIKYNDEI